MFGFAKKIGMTRLFVDGRSTPVTVLSFDKQYIAQRKTQDNDGYSALQIATSSRKKGTKQRKGHFLKHTGLEQDFRLCTEFRDVNVADDKKVLEITDFSPEDTLNITGTTIGRGFAGVVKRHGFHGQPASHGHDHVRAPGSIGSRWPQRTLPGKKMAGHMGAKPNTLRNVKIVALDPEKKLIFVNGSLPGANSSYLKVAKAQ
jgi:large subunit ribosomal protein L3